MSRLNHETNEWHCKVVLFGPPTRNAVKLAAQLVTAIPLAEREVTWDTPPAEEPTLVARYRPANAALGDIKPVYMLHTLRSAGSTAADRQHVLHNTDGVILLLDLESEDQSIFAERELERFLSTYGKTIASMPVILLGASPLDDGQQARLNANSLSYFAAENATSLQRALHTLTSGLEEDSGLAGIGFDLDDFDSDGSAVDLDDIEFDDLHAYDDDDLK